MLDDLGFLSKLSQVLTWGAFALAILAASATAARQFVERRISEKKAALAATQAAEAGEKRRIADEDVARQLAEAASRVEQANDRALVAASTAEAVRLAHEPRADRLRAQRAVLVNNIRSIGPGHVRFGAIGDTEASALAAECQSIFADAGWSVGPLDGFFAPGNPQGILFKHAGDARGRKTLAALVAAGLEIEGVIESGREEIYVSIYFRPRPQSQ